MDNLEYLNQIAQSNRPLKQNVSFFSGPIIKAIIAGVVGLVVLIGFGAIFGNKTARSDTLTEQIYIRTVNLENTVSTYNRSLKISSIRATSLSLSATLNNAANQLGGYFANKGIDMSEPTESIAAEEEESAAKLDDMLNRAKLNGILDRIYSTQVTVQISLLRSLVIQDIDSTRDQDLVTILQSYADNLQVIEDSLKSYALPANS